MNRARLEALWQQAQARQIVPADAGLPAHDDDDRPWPVVLLTALGAWLAAIPMLAVVALTLGPLFRHGPGAGLAGALLLGVAVALLRTRLPLFVEQLAVPLLLAGGASLGFGLNLGMDGSAWSASMALLALGVAAAVPPRWLKAGLGAAAAFFVAWAFWPWRWGGASASGWAAGWGWQACLAVWLLACWREARAGLGSGALAVLAGWLLMTLLGLSAGSGETLFVGAGGLHGGAGGGGHGLLLSAMSAACALGGAAWLTLAWPPLRRWPFAGVALVLAGLAFFMPQLGAVLLALAGCAVQQRWRLAAAALLAALWIVGSFYYQLAWPLGLKAEVLAGAGLLLGLLAWPLRSPSPSAPAAADGHGRSARWGATACLVAVLLVVNAAIVQKEALIAQGQPVFVPLAPADPRSLMQGDYMRLAFALPDGVASSTEGLLSAQRPQVVATLDARRVATLRRLHGGEPLAPGELLIELTPKGGRWTLVTDAWFFKEGEAERWTAARFGEFRVTPGGQALLVSLRGTQLEKL